MVLLSAKVKAGCRGRMFYISEQQIEVMRKRFWLFLLLALLFLAVLLLVPRGELARNPESDSWTNIMPSGLFEPNEDGTSYGYKDQCGSDARCRSCNGNIAWDDCRIKWY